MDSPKPETLYSLEPGVVYIVKKPFSDYHGNKFETGQTLTFEGRSFFAYDDGHTLYFREASVFLQEGTHDAILGSFPEYFGVHDESGRRPVQTRYVPLVQPTVSAFLGGLAMVALCVFVIVIDKRSWILGSVGILFFGTITFMEGRGLWSSRRDPK
jgi:Domain of unknown function (DUF3601)